MISYSRQEAKKDVWQHYDSSGLIGRVQDVSFQEICPTDLGFCSCGSHV